MSVSFFDLKCKELSIIVLHKIKNICIRYARFRVQIYSKEYVTAKPK